MFELQDGWRIERGPTLGADPDHTAGRLVGRSITRRGIVAIAFAQGLHLEAASTPSARPPRPGTPRLGKPCPGCGDTATVSWRPGCWYCAICDDHWDPNQPPTMVRAPRPGMGREIPGAPDNRTGVSPGHRS